MILYFRLDVDSKLPEALKLAFVFSPSESKSSILLHLLRSAIKADELTIVFAATMHHVEYLQLVQWLLYCILLFKK